MARNDEWERPTQPDRDIHFRHGVLMAQVRELTERVEALERLHDEDVRARSRRSLRPTVERVSVSAIVAGAVTALIQLVQLLR